MKKVANVFTAPAKHWVGNGFHVASMFSYNDKDKNLDPFLLMDYNEPKFFQGGRRDDSEFALRGVGEHPHRGFETVLLLIKVKYHIGIHMAVVVLLVRVMFSG